MKEKKNRLSKLSIVAFVIVCFCLVSITTQHSQAQTLGASNNTSFIGIVWNYFFPTPANNSNLTGDDPDPTPTPTPTFGEATPRPTLPPCGVVRCSDSR
jgi:hypothetical protein